MINDLEILEQHRDALLLAEASAWLHMLGNTMKTSWLATMVLTFRFRPTLQRITRNSTAF